MSASSRTTPGMATTRHGESDVTAVGARWKAPTTAHQMNATYRNIVLVEKRRRASEHAAKDLTESLKHENLNALRQKAVDLQKDKWMYEDVHIALVYWKAGC